MIPLATISPPAATIIAAAIAAFFGWLAVRGNRRMQKIERDAAAQAQQVQTQATERAQASVSQQASYDQLQEDLKELRAEMAAQKRAHAEEMVAVRRDEIAPLRAEVASSQRRERQLETYTWLLRRHIERELGPPPPEWPPGLEAA